MFFCFLEMKTPQKCDAIIDCQVCQCKLDLPVSISDNDDIATGSCFDLSDLDVCF